MRVTVTSKGRTVTASYQGGAYIDLSFGGGPVMEVINAYDYAKGEARIKLSTSAVRAQVKEWIRENDEEWPEWYECYREEARYY